MVLDRSRRIAVGQPEKATRRPGGVTSEALEPVQGELQHLESVKNPLPRPHTNLRKFTRMDSQCTSRRDMGLPGMGPPAADEGLQVSLIQGQKSPYV